MKNTFFLFMFLLYLRPADGQELPVYQAKPENDKDFYEVFEGEVSDVLPGCSWYCGGSVSHLTVTSQLPDYQAIAYGAQQAHDFNIATAWVEGQDGYGEGERITYHFDLRDQPGHELGITTLLIANGYKKSPDLWKKNSRVKRLRMYLNDQPYADIELLDILNFQSVDIGVIMLPDHEPLTLSFEIIAVYPGDRYTDTALTELLFDGVGAH